MNKDLEEFLKTRKRPTVLLGPLERALMLQQRSSDRRTDVLHPSEITEADWCIRQSWFLLRGAEKPAERLGLRTRSIFAEGHAIHAKWQSWLEDAGFLLGEWECPACADAWWGTPEGGCGCGGHTYKEVPVVDDDLHVLGHADGWVRVPDQPDALLEIKSIGIGTIRSMGGRISGGLASSFGMIDRPYSPHVRQAMFYLYILRRMYEKGLIEDVPPERIVFIYECKEDQAAKEFVVEYDEEWIAGVLMKLDELRLAKGTPPCTGDTASDGYCDQCRSYV